MTPVSVTARLRQHCTGGKHSWSIDDALFDCARKVRMCATSIANGREATVEKMLGQHRLRLHQPP